MKRKERELEDLISIGPAMLRDFELLCIRSVAQLAKQDPKKMYARLGRIAKQHQDLCADHEGCFGKEDAENGAQRAQSEEKERKGRGEADDRGPGAAELAGGA